MEAAELAAGADRSLRRFAPSLAAAQLPRSFCGSVTAYQGVEGTRPYAGAAWYYAEYRGRVGDTFLTMLATRLGWSSQDRILDLGAGPGQLSVPLAALVGEVVALEPEADMVTKGKRRVRNLDIKNIRFVLGGSDDLTNLRRSLGIVSCGGDGLVLPLDG